MQLKTGRPRILVVGDLMLDRYYFGSSDRISPEAPLAIVNVERKENRLGGAANVIYNLQVLGAKVYPCGVVGNDDYGKILINEIKGKKIDTSGVIKINNRKTTVKNRVMVEHHNMVRFDEETDENIQSNHSKKLFDFVKKNSKVLDCIVISDYDKGAVTKDLVNRIRDLSIKNNINVIVDPKKRNHKLKYGPNSIIKTNIQNARLVLGIDNKESDLQKIITELNNINESKGVIVTLGREGMIAGSGDKNFRITNSGQNVFDVTGAGDVVMAAFSYFYSVGNDFRTSCKLANIAAGIKVGKIGTTTVSLDEIKNQVSR